MAAPDSTSVAETWGYTKVEVITFSYLWTIKNFRLLCKDDMRLFLQSSTFTSTANDKLTWCLRLYLRGIDDICRDYLSICPVLLSANKPVIRAECKFSLLNGKKELKNIKKSRRVYKLREGNGWVFKKFVKREFLLDEANGLLPKGNLEIHCEISVVDDSICISGPSKYDDKFIIPKCKLPDEIGKLFESKKFSDVTISVKGTEFEVHKNILTARSPVFAAMFEHDMEEKKLNHILIIDIEPEAIKEMLRFIYSGKVENLEKIADGLLVAADKYALERLKILCEKALCKNITVENSTNLLLLADVHSAEQLKTRVINFIRTHMMEISKLPDWKTLKNSHPILMAEALLIAQQEPPPDEPSPKRIKDS